MSLDFHARDPCSNACSNAADFAAVRECPPKSKSLVLLRIRILTNGDERAAEVWGSRPDSGGLGGHRTRHLGQHFGVAFPGDQRGHIARPDTPKRSEATTDNLIGASASSFSTRCLSAVRAVTQVRVPDCRLMGRWCGASRRSCSARYFPSYLGMALTGLTPT